MPNFPLILEGANLYCGDLSPTASNHLILSELRLPAIERNYQDHAAGGSPVAIEVDTHVSRLEASFALVGWQPQILRLLNSTHDETFTAFGLLRNRKYGTAHQAQAKIQGRLGRAAPTVFARGETQVHEYAIRGIMHYELAVDGDAIVIWDFWEAATSTIRQEDVAVRIRRSYGGALE